VSRQKPTSSRDDAPFRAVVVQLRRARRIVILTGAGISRESGLPTFREAQLGLWAAYSPQELATPEAFVRDPALVWQWYAWRRRLVLDATPNAGHFALAALARRHDRVTLITQNVDGLHRRAGSPDVIELHGDITQVRCNACGSRAAPVPLPDDEPPRCGCGGMFRPDVVWFGEMLPGAVLERAIDEAAACDLFLAIGTSGVVYPAAGLVGLAARAGATIVVVNPDPAAVPAGAVHLGENASTALPALIAAAWSDAG
jgi:NAD-dependent deacetylase